MKKATSCTIVLCIALLATTVHSSEVEALLPSPPTWSAFFFHPIETTQNVLSAVLDTMLSRENKNATAYYKQTMDILLAAKTVVKEIGHTVEEKTYAFEGIYSWIDEAKRNKSREIFQDWVQRGVELKSNYSKCAENNIVAVEKYHKTILDTQHSFNQLRSFRTELDECINVVDRFGWGVPIACTAWCGFKILKATATIRHVIPVYEKAVEDLQTLLDNVENSEKCPNFMKITPAALKKFNWEAIRILEHAENYDDVPKYSIENTFRFSP